MSSGFANGSTIRQIDVQKVTYFHVELSRHAAILAENLPVESYLDTGDRNAFANASNAQALHPVWGEAGGVAMLMDAIGFAPLQVWGEAVERVRALLAERAAALKAAALQTPTPRSACAVVLSKDVA